MSIHLHGLQILHCPYHVGWRCFLWPRIQQHHAFTAIWLPPVSLNSWVFLYLKLLKWELLCVKWYVCSCKAEWVQKPCRRCRSREIRERNNQFDPENWRRSGGSKSRYLISFVAGPLFFAISLNDFKSRDPAVSLLWWNWSYKSVGKQRPIPQKYLVHQHFCCVLVFLHLAMVRSIAFRQQLSAELFFPLQMEITNDIQFLLPIMVAIMVAKWVGDFATHPLYHALLELKCIPFLDSEPVILHEGSKA